MYTCASYHCRATERFSIECCKSETKVITTANQRKRNTFKGQLELKVKNSNCPKRGKTRATKEWLFKLFHPIGWENGASFLNQSQSKWSETNVIPDCFRHWIENCSNTKFYKRQPHLSYRNLEWIIILQWKSPRTVLLLTNETLLLLLPQLLSIHVKLFHSAEVCHQMTWLLL